MGEEDIEVEIEQIKERKTKGEKHPKDPDLSTTGKENVHRNKRNQDVRDAISRIRLLE